MVRSRICSFSQLIGDWPGTTEHGGGISGFAHDTAISYVNSQVMRHRNSISPDHWPDVVRAAESIGMDFVTMEFLSELRANRKAKKSDAVHQTQPNAA